MINLLCVSAFLSNFREVFSKEKYINGQLTHICAIIELKYNIKIVKNVESIVQNVYHNGYYLNCKQTSFAEIHLRFQGYVSVSPVVLYVTMDECTLQYIHTFHGYICVSQRQQVVKQVINTQSIYSVLILDFLHGLNFKNETFPKLSLFLSLPED